MTWVRTAHFEMPSDIGEATASILHLHDNRVLSRQLSDNVFRQYHDLIFG